MAINKNFVVKNGLEVYSNLIIANADISRVGIGTTLPQYKLEVTEDIGSDSLYVGRLRNTLSVKGATGIGGSVGIGTSLPSCLLDIRSPVSTGKTAVYVKGDVRITGVSTVEGPLSSISGPIVVGSATSTGTPLQNLQVFGGGAFIQEGVGIGTTIARAQLHVYSITDQIVGLFSGSTSYELVRITQTGSGNALLVEDSVNPDATPFVIDSVGNVGIATTTSSSKLTVLGDVRFTNGISTITNLNTISGIVTYISGVGATITTLESTNASLGNINSSGIATIGILTSSSAFINSLRITGVSTFTNGPVLIGGGSSTGTSGQVLQISGVSSSVYIGGNLGIGSTNPPSKLTVIGDARISGVVTSTYYYGDGRYLTNLSVVNIANYGINIYDDASLIGVAATIYFGENLKVTGGSGSGIATVTTTDDIRIVGSLGIGTTATSKLHVIGDARVSGVITATDFNSLSDSRYKENIVTANNALLRIEQLRGVKFDWKESGNPSYGVIAQELEEVFPELVHGIDPKTVNYNGIIGILIEAVKELSVEVQKLNDKLNN